MSIDTALQLAVPFLFDAEGCRLVAYLDRLATIPVWTIGHGSTWVDGKPVTYGMTCTRTQADHWAGDDLRERMQWVRDAVIVPLTDAQLAALSSLVFNIGIGRFRASNVLQALNLGLYQVAADRLLEYDHAGGVVVVGLSTRRARERRLFMSGNALSSATLAASRSGAAANAVDETLAAETVLSEADVLNQAQLDHSTKAT